MAERRAPTDQPITSAARRIARAHNQCPETEGTLAFNADGEGGQWFPPNRHPIAEVVFPIAAAAVTEREAQDWLDGYWRRHAKTMTDRYGPVGALIYNRYWHYVVRIEAHNADGSVTSTIVAHPRTARWWYGAGGVGTTTTHRTGLERRDEILDQPAPIKLTAAEKDVVLRLVEAGWSVAPYADGLQITAPRGRAYDSLRSADRALPLVTA